MKKRQVTCPTSYRRLSQGPHRRELIMVSLEIDNFPIELSDGHAAVGTPPFLTRIR